MFNKLKILMVFAVLTIPYTLYPIPSCYAAFEDFGIGARAMAMGNAYLAVAGDATSIYSNPAGLVQVRRPEVGITAAGLFQPSGGSFYGYLGYAEPIYGLGYYFGAGYLSRNMNLVRRYRENSLGISYARPIDANTSWGLTLKVCSKEYPDNTATISTNLDSSKFFTERFPSGLSVDAGLLYSIPNIRGFKIAFVCADMGAGIWSFRTGMSYKIDEFKTLNNILGSMDIALRGDGDFKLNLGVEAWFKPTEKLKKTLKENLFALRTGLKFGGGGDFSWAVGAGIRSNNLEKTDWKFDIALVVPYHSSVEPMSTGLWVTASVLFGDAFKWEKDEKLRIDKEKSLKEEMERLLAEKRKLEEEKKMLEENQGKALDELKRLQGITVREDREKNNNSCHGNRD